MRDCGGDADRRLEQQADYVAVETKHVVDKSRGGCPLHPVFFKVFVQSVVVAPMVANGSELCLQCGGDDGSGSLRIVLRSWRRWRST